MKKQDSSEFDNFDRTMRDLMRVPHSEITAELEAERAAKKKIKVKRNDNRQQGNDKPK